ncbi:phage tail protein [Brucella sp. TWI432]
MALMILGPVIFDLRNNITGRSRNARMAYAKHDVIGAAPVYEAMGADEATANLECVLHPFHFGGLGRLEALHLAMQAQIPLSLLRGDGVPLGWHTINEIDEKHGEISTGGVGQEITFSLKLTRVDTPLTSMATSIVSLLL